MSNLIGVRFINRPEFIIYTKRIFEAMCLDPTVQDIIDVETGEVLYAKATE